MSRKKLIILVVFLIVAVLASVFYFFAVYRMESALQSLVASQSNGKLHFEVKKIRLNIFELRFDINESEIFTVDSTNAESGYRIKTSRILIDVHSLVSVISRKHLVIDSIIIQSPTVEVVKYKDIQHAKISLHDEISKVYQSLESALKVVNLHYLHIDDAKIVIDNRANPEIKPLTVSNIQLTIDNVTEENDASKDRFLFADRILLEIYDQDIVLPDGIHGISFKRFWMGTRSRMVKLDSCYVYGLNADSLSGEFNVFLDSIRISKLDFNMLAKSNTLKVDSAICYNPDINFKLHLKTSTEKVDLLNDTPANRKLVEQNLKNMLGNFDIGYLGVMNAKIKIVTEKDNKENIFESQNSNFSIGKFFVSTDENVPIKLEEFDLDIRNYLGYSPDSMYVIELDGIRVKDDKIQLINFGISSTSVKRKKDKRMVKMQTFEIDDINWPVLFYEHRILAGHASLINPELRITLPGVEKRKPAEMRENPFVILSKVKEKIGIGDLYFENGLFDIKIQNGPSLYISNGYAGINVNRLLESENAVRLIDAIDTVSFGKGTFKNPSIQLSVNKMRYSQKLNWLYFGLIKENKTDQSSVTSIKDAKIDGINIRSFSDIELSRLSWSQADLFLKLPKKAEGQLNEDKKNQELNFTLNKLKGGPTILRLSGENIEVSTNVNQISTDEIIIKPGQKVVINSFNIDGQSISVMEDQVEGTISLFNIQDQKESSIENVKIALPVNGEKLSIFVPRLVFSSDINESFGGNFTAGFIELHQPEISFSPIHSNSEVKPKKGESRLPQMQIGNLIIDQPKVKSLPASLSGKMLFDPGNLQINILGIYSDSLSVNVDSIRVSALNPDFGNDKFKMKSTGEASLFVKGSDLEFRPAKSETKASWSGNINSFKSTGIKLDMLQNDSVKQSVAIGSLNFNDLKLSSAGLNDCVKLIKDNPYFSVSNGNIVFENCKNHFEAFNLAFNKSTSSISVDSLAFFPVIDRDAFMATKEYQSNYIQLFSGPIKVADIDFEKAVVDTVFNVKKITANNIHFMDYKDKRLPFQHDIEKPFLTEMFKKIKPKFAVDSIIIRNSGIEYEEFNDKTLLYGKINFTKIRGGITGVKNYNLSATDSLMLNVYARFMDATDLRLRFKQSYTDSLSGFHLKVIGSSFDLRKLNPLLEPFVSAEVKTGHLDTLRMSVIGRKYVAFGVMKMHYNGLNVQYLDKGNEIHQSLKAKTISFFANRIVHKNNRFGTGSVYAERDPEKGFVNYWVKILVGGVLTNAGVRTEKKQIKKYEKGLKLHEVPPIPDIPVDF